MGFFSENCVVGRICPAGGEYGSNREYGEAYSIALFPDVIQPYFIYPMLMLPKISFVTSHEGEMRFPHSRRDGLALTIGLY